MDLKEALGNGVEIETMAGRVFRRLQQCFAHDPEASSVFAKMSQEEGEHAAVIQRQLDMIVMMPDAFVAIDDAVRDQQQALISRMQETLQEATEHPPTLETALGICFELEEEVEEVHERAITNLIRTTGKLAVATVAFEAISFQEGPDHTKGLCDLARKHGVTIPAGEH